MSAAQRDVEQEEFEFVLREERFINRIKFIVTRLAQRGASSTGSRNPGDLSSIIPLRIIEQSIYKKMRFGY